MNIQIVDFELTLKAPIFTFLKQRASEYDQEIHGRPPDKSALLKIIFLISQPKHSKELSR